MNHLAHLFLSQSDINLMIGNFIADHVKGKQINSFSKEIVRGIKMHREIDAFTDHHPTVKQSKERLYPKYHKYSSVIVDMFYDHILARNWDTYSPISLKSFASSSYQILNAQSELFPEHSKRFLHYMSKYDWLTDYVTLEGISKALNGLAQRANFDSKMDQSPIDLKRDYKEYEAEFKVFFPLLFEHCQEWLKLHD